MFKLSEKATELLKKKLSLNYKEEETLKKDFFEFDEDAFKVDESGKETTSSDSNFFGMLKNVFSSNKEEKAILNDILSSFVSINQSFDNVVDLLMGNVLIAASPEGEVPSEVIAQPGSKRKRKKEKSSFLSNIMKIAGLAAFAFSPAILDFLKEDPEKIKESLTKAFDWITTDLPSFFKNDLGPIISNFLDTEIIGSITGMDILKSAGIATALYAGKGVILNLLTKALLSTTGWFLKSFFGFLVSPAGLAILAAGFVGTGLAYVVGKIGDYADEKRKTEAEEAEAVRVAEEAAPNVEKNRVVKEILGAAPAYIKQNENGARSVISGKVDKILGDGKSKEAKQFKKLSPEEKWKKIDKTLTPDERRSIKGEKKTARELLDETKSETPSLDAKVAQMFPDATMVLQADYKTQAFGTSEQRQAARDALAKEGVNAEKDPTIVSAKEAELQAQPELPRKPAANAIPIVDMTAQNGGDKTTGEGQALSFMGSDQQTSVDAESVAVTPPTLAMAQMPSTTEQSSQVESSGSSIESFINNYINAAKPIGNQIGEASAEVSAPRKPKPIVIPPPRQTQKGKMMIKPGESWNINDVPDPTPKLGNLLSQLFVPETNFSGAISI